VVPVSSVNQLFSTKKPVSLLPILSRSISACTLSELSVYVPVSLLHGVEDATFSRTWVADRPLAILRRLSPLGSPCSATDVVNSTIGVLWQCLSSFSESEELASPTTPVPPGLQDLSWSSTRSSTNSPLDLCATVLSPKSPRLVFVPR